MYQKVISYLVLKKFKFIIILLTLKVKTETKN